MVSSRDYTVHLEQVFQGPLDLLLHLVREQEVEIHEIDISAIIEGYLSYLESLQELNLEYAADFLVMAATLMSIKSRSLLPREEVDLEDELDPKDELIQRLIEYRRFKEAGDDLGRRWEEHERRFPRGDNADMPEEPERTFELGELTVWDLLAVYSRLMRETLADAAHTIVSDPRPLRFYVDNLVESLQSAGDLSLRRLMTSLEGLPPREALVGSFCALLELVRMQLVEVRQNNAEEDIAIHLREEHAEDAMKIVAQSLPQEDEIRATEPGAENGEENGAAGEADQDSPEEPEEAPDSPDEAAERHPDQNPEPAG